MAWSDLADFEAVAEAPAHQPASFDAVRARGATPPNVRLLEARQGQHLALRRPVRRDLPPRKWTGLSRSAFGLAEDAVKIGKALWPS